MKKAQVYEVRDQLAKYLSQAEQGEEIVITRHEKPVARLVAYENKIPVFPDLTEFRESLDVEGSVLKTLLKTRREARY
jgi:prevent-host-death family protein